MSNDDYSDLPTLSLRYMVEDYEKLIKMGPPKNGTENKGEKHADYNRIENQIKRSA